MKYIYKETGIVVESDTALDSIIFKPVIDANSEAKKKDKKTVKVSRKSKD